MHQFKGGLSKCPENPGQVPFRKQSSNWWLLQEKALIQSGSLERYTCIGLDIVSSLSKPVWIAATDDLYKLLIVEIDNPSSNNILMKSATLIT